MLADALQVNTALEELILTSSMTPIVAGRAFASVIEHNATLKVLELAQGFMSDVSGRAVATALAKNTGLRELGLRSNYLTGTTALVGALRINTTLVKLDLSNNSLGDGVADIAAVLLDNYTLRDLNLRKNEISGESGEALAKLVAEGNLRVLNLSHNPLGSAGDAYKGRSWAGVLHYLSGLGGPAVDVSKCGVLREEFIADAFLLKVGIDELLL